MRDTAIFLLLAVSMHYLIALAAVTDPIRRAVWRWLRVRVVEVLTAATVEDAVVGHEIEARRDAIAARAKEIVDGIAAGVRCGACAGFWIGAALHVFGSPTPPWSAGVAGLLLSACAGMIGVPVIERMAFGPIE